MKLYPRREIALQLDIPPEVFLERLAAAVRGAGRASARRSRAFSGRVEGEGFEMEEAVAWFEWLLRRGFRYSVKGRVCERAGGCEVSATVWPSGGFVAWMGVGSLVATLVSTSIVYHGLRLLLAGAPSAAGFEYAAFLGLWSLFVLGLLWAELHRDAEQARRALLLIANPSVTLPPLIPPPSWGP